jgi:hypothetical protein
MCSQPASQSCSQPVSLTDRCQSVPPAATAPQVARVARLARVFRLLKVAKVMWNSQLRRQLEDLLGRATLQMLNFALLCLLLVHWSACIYYWFGTMDGPRAVDSWVFHAGLAEASDAERYAACLWGVQLHSQSCMQHAAGHVSDACVECACCAEAARLSARVHNCQRVVANQCSSPCLSAALASSSVSYIPSPCQPLPAPLAGSVLLLVT